MDIFELSEEEIKKVLEEKLSKITPDELLEELIECGLEIKEDLNFENEFENAAEYTVAEQTGNYECNSWIHIKTTGWTSFKEGIFKVKNDSYDILEEVA